MKKKIFKTIVSNIHDTPQVISWEEQDKIYMITDLILQTVYKEIERKMPEKLTSTKDYNDYQQCVADGHNGAIDAVEKVIKQIMEVEG